MRGVLRYVPPVRWLKRTVQMKIRESLYEAVADSSSGMAKFTKDMALNLLHKQLADHPEMWEALTPKYDV